MTFEGKNMIDSTREKKKLGSQINVEELPLIGLVEENGPVNERSDWRRKTTREGGHRGQFSRASL